MATPSTNRPLTKTQLNYAIDRLNGALNTRLEKAIAHLTVPASVSPLTAEEKYSQIVTGKAKIMPLAEIRHNYLLASYRYPAHEAKEKTAAAARTKYAEDCAKAQKPVHAAYRAAMDTLVMGSAEAALAVVEAFAAGK